ncbi:hypothetical protein SLS63_008599 [Diaporthe eres]|uniref:Uncharacterized protein n=1 Tax=Diaporthe eres TaxID=83184 RepID=A0ABR1P253_DIAER
MIDTARAAHRPQHDVHGEKAKAHAKHSVVSCSTEDDATEQRREEQPEAHRDAGGAQHLTSLLLVNRVYQERKAHRPYDRGGKALTYPPGDEHADVRGGH